MKTVSELLDTAPDSQAIRTRNAWCSVATGHYSEAAFYLENAASEEGETEWAREALETAGYFKGENFVAIEQAAAIIERASK